MYLLKQSWVWPQANGTGARAYLRQPKSSGMGGKPGFSARTGFQHIQLHCDDSGFYQVLGSVIGQVIGQLPSPKLKVSKKIESFSKYHQDSYSQSSYLKHDISMGLGRRWLWCGAGWDAYKYLHAVMVSNHSLSLVCIHCYLFVLDYCHHGDKHANSNTEKKFTLCSLQKMEKEK